MSWKVLVISPSGNLYGSEQVLCDYLAGSSLLFEVSVPANSKLENQLKGTRHKVVTFSNVRTLYVKLFFQLLKGDFNAVYVNEGGHSRYVQLFASLFPKVRFIAHVRILEDTHPSRWRSSLRRNTVVVCISDYLKQLLAIDSIHLNDPFPFPETVRSECKPVQHPLQVAVIGRLTQTKGFRELLSFAEAVEKHGKENELSVNIYGDVMKDVAMDPSFEEFKNKKFIRIHGFVPGESIYAVNNVVLHLSKVEALGRIFFEAVAHGLPLVGFNTAGIGEIASNVGLEDLLVEPRSDAGEEILEKIFEISLRRDDTQRKLNSAFDKMKEIYSLEVYTRSMDRIILAEALK